MVWCFHRLKKERKLVLPISATVNGAPPDLMFLSGHQRKSIFPRWYRVLWNPYGKKRGGSCGTVSRPGVGGQRAVFRATGGQDGACGIEARSGDHRRFVVPHTSTTNG